MDEKKIILSGVQPSGVLTIGNYIGAVKNWTKLQEDFECLFMIVDMHAITVRQDPVQLRKRCMDFLALYLACGLNPEKSTLFFQSHVHQHAELSWVLNCNTYMGELSRMTQFKDKTRNAKDVNIGAGLFTYPVLMAADILLYQADLVPVGVDQSQHLELTRTIAERFNRIYGETFKIPDGYIPKIGAKITSLADPLKKMSKSDENVNGYVSVIDDADTIMRKFKRAVTDSGSEIRPGEGKEGIENLMTIMSAFTGKSMEDIANEFSGKGYGEFKVAVAEAVIEELSPIREKYLDFQKNKDYLVSIYKDGALKAAYRAEKTIRKVYRKVGFVDKEVRK